MNILDELLDEVGIKDIIYIYSCGISFIDLNNIVRFHFKSIVEKDKKDYEQIYINLVDYFFRVFSRGNKQGNKLHIKIFLRHVSRLLSDKRDIGVRMLFRYNNEGLYSAIGNIIKDIEEKYEIDISNIYYATK